MSLDTRHDPTAPSTGALLTQLAQSMTELVHKEGQLLRAEVGQKYSQLMTALGMIAAGVVFALVALNVLAAALVAAVAEAGVEPGWAALIVGGVIALAALGLAMKGANDLKTANLAPSKFMRNVQRDATLAKEAVR